MTVCFKMHSLSYWLIITWDYNIQQDIFISIFYLKFHASRGGVKQQFIRLYLSIL